MSTRYTLPAILIHWLTAVLVIALFALGWYMVDLPRGPERSETFALHKSIGLTVLLLTAVRMFWRLRHPPPAYPETTERWRVRVARIVHMLFYVALVAQPLSGYLSSSFSGYKTRYFGVPLPHWGRRDLPLNEFFTDIHVACSVILFVLVIAHLLGALSHLFERDGMFSRMLPWISRKPGDGG